MAGLLHGGFWHENYEFVAAVASDNVGTAAIGFENLADALENEVAFEVAVKIVNELEAIEVHQDQSERTAGAGRALPFGRERFHEKAVSLNAGEAVGDGLLLRFLESKCVVKRGGDQVGESAEKERFLFGELHGLKSFDVENAVKMIGVEDGKAHGGGGVGKHRLHGSLIVGE